MEPPHTEVTRCGGAGRRLVGGDGRHIFRQQRDVTHRSRQRIAGESPSSGPCRGSFRKKARTARRRCSKCSGRFYPLARQLEKQLALSRTISLLSGAGIQGSGTARHNPRRTAQCGLHVGISFQALANLATSRYDQLRGGVEGIDAPSLSKINCGTRVPIP